MVDEELSQQLGSMGLSPASARLVALIPLIGVAWADGAIQPEERHFILGVARDHGLDDPAGRAILERWLSVEPGPAVTAIAAHLVRVLVDRTEPPRLDAAILEEIVDWCGGVASAAGGLFGYGRVSSAEKSALEEIADLVRGRAVDGDDWVMMASAQSPSEISLWSRRILGATLRAFRGATHARTSVETAVGFLLDAARMKDWLFRCDEARILSRQDDGDWLVYLAIHGIWPLQDRDAVIRVRPELTAAGEVHFKGTVAQAEVAQTKDRVRIPSIESSWRVAQAAEGLVQLEWTGHFDPVGEAPPWLVNMATMQVPRYALRRVQSLLESAATAEHTKAGRACIEEQRARL